MRTAVDIKRASPPAPRWPVLLSGGLLLLCLAGCATRPGTAPPNLLFLREVNVVDVLRGEVRTEQDILVADGLIRAIGPAGEEPIPLDAIVHDVPGSCVIPGLWDMHAHVIENWETAFPLLLANGVTGIRNLHAFGPDPLGAVHDLREAMRDGAIRGPILVANGPIVDGPGPVWRDSVAVTGPEDARAAVRELHSRGADFIKVYDLLSREAYFAIAEMSTTGA